MIYCIVIVLYSNCIILKMSCELCGISYDDGDHSSCEVNDEFNNELKENIQIIKQIENLLPKNTIIDYTIVPLTLKVKQGSDLSKIKYIIKTNNIMINFDNIGIMTPSMTPLQIHQ